MSKSRTDTTISSGEADTGQYCGIDNRLPLLFVLSPGVAEGPASALSCDSLPVELLGRPLFAALLEGELPLKAAVSVPPVPKN
jgi:hypothetical protein